MAPTSPSSRGPSASDSAASPHPHWPAVDRLSPPPSTTLSEFPPETSLRHPVALATLSALPQATPTLLAGLVKTFETYESLAAASPTERAAISGHPAAAFLPAELPTLRRLNLPPGLSVLSPASAHFPGLLRPYQEVAPVLFSQGAPLHPTAPVAVLGDSRPTPTARAAAKIAVRSAALYGLPLVVLLSNRLGADTAFEALAQGATVWGVLSSGHSFAPDFHLISEVCAAGGTVLSTTHWLRPATPGSRAHAERLAVILSAAVVCTSDPVPGFASDSAAPSLALDYHRPRFIPTPADPASPRVSDLGIKMATDPRFASSTDHPTADVICSGPADLDAAIFALASQVSPTPHQATAPAPAPSAQKPQP